MTQSTALNQPRPEEQQSPLRSPALRRSAMRRSATPRSATPRSSQGAILLSSAFLLAIVLLSAALYVPYLGFYSDDWSFLSLLKNSHDQSFTGLFHSLMSDHNIRVRPVQVAALVSLYQLFGLSPLGYHVCNTLLLAAMALLLFQLLLELKQPLVLAVSLPAVYILLPNYSTDHFWIAALQANISMAFFFASFYCALRSLRSGWSWLVLSALSTVVSVLSYEVAVPLFALAVIVVLWMGNARIKALLAAAATSVGVLGCLMFKVVINQRPVMAPGTFWTHAVSVVHQSVFVNFFQLGVAYPRVVFKVVRQHSDPSALLAAALIALLVFFYLRWIVRRQPESLSQIRWIGVAMAGLLVFALGYAIFLTTDQVAFHKTGVANRTAIAAALGVASCFLALAGYISIKVMPRLRILCFSLLVSFLCSSGALIDIALARSWVQAYGQEQKIIRNIAAHRLSPQPGSAFLVDGVCPYVGPAPLMESSWEVTGVAQLVFRWPDLRGDALSSRVHLNRDSLTTDIYGEKASYPYGDKFLLYNVALDRVFVIHNSAEMARYLREYGHLSTVNMNCPGLPGEGVAVF